MTSVAESQLTDPEFCGEDLSDNLRRLFTLAPTQCAGCADYHIVNALKRLSGQTGWSGGTRRALVSVLQPLLSEFARHDRKHVDVLVAGCADTAVLATCAHAAWSAGETLFRRTGFTVVDRCPTPLVLCQEFSHRHGLATKTAVVDLLDTTERFSVDVILLHNLLIFIPEDRHADLLHVLGGWLKPNGRIVMWQPLVSPQSRTNYRTNRSGRFDFIVDMIKDGSIEINEPLEVLQRRIERNIDDFLPGRQRTSDAQSLLATIASAGLPILSDDIFTFRAGSTSLAGMLAVIGRPS